MTPRDPLVINGKPAEWIDSDEKLGELLATRDVDADYALDTEFIAGQAYFTELSLVQIAWPDTVGLIDPYLVDLTPLRPLFEGAGRALLHAAAGDLELLEIAVGIRPAQLFDTQIAGQFLGLSTPSLAHLVQRYCNVALDKSLQRTDWTVRPLPDPVRHYAASDVAYLHRIVDLMSNELGKRGRLEWVEIENEVARTLPSPTRTPEELWWRLPRATSIPPGRQLGAQRLAMLRDVRARGRNRPPSHILQDDAVVALASKPPRSISEFHKVKGCHNIPEPFAHEILRLLADASESPADDLRRLPHSGVPSEIEPLVNVLLAVANQRALDCEIDAKLLATRKDISEVVLEQSSRLDSGWRVEIITADIRRLLEGQATIAIAGSRLVVRR